MTVIALTLPVAAHAQLSSAEFVTNTGELTLDIGTNYDSNSILLSRIYVTDGNQNVTMEFNNFVQVRSGILTLDVDPTDTDTINSMHNPLAVMGEGSLKIQGLESPVWREPLMGIVQIGAVIPEEHQDMTSVAQLSESHFNQMLERYGHNWRIEMVLKSGDDPLVSLLDLNQENIAVAIGDDFVVEVNRLAKLGMTILGCCADDINYDLLVDDALSSALIPDDDESLKATLALMSDTGINRIIPVYPSKDSQIYGQIVYLAQSAVDEGIQYDTTLNDNQIAALIAETVTSQVMSTPGIRLGVLLTEADDTYGILEASSPDRSLTRSTWFGLGLHPDITGNPAVASFAQDVDYTVPRPTGLENPITVSLASHIHDTLHHEADPIAFGAYDAVQIVGLSILGSVDISGHSADSFTNLNLASFAIATTIPKISSEYGGYTTYTGMDETGGLKAPVHAMYTVRGDNWVRTSMYNNPTHTHGGYIPFGDAILPLRHYTAGDPLIDDVIPIGLLVEEYETYTAGIAARMGLAMLDGEHTLVVNGVADGNPAGTMSLFDDMGVSLVLAHAPELSMLDISQYAKNHEMLAISTASSTKILSTPNDNTFRMIPSDTWQAKALTGILHHGNTHGLVVIHADRPEMKLLYDDIASEFVGEIGATYVYDTDNVRGVMSDVLQATNDMISKYGIDKTAILVIGHEDLATDVMDAATGSTLNVRWYGSMGMAGSHKIMQDAPNAIDFTTLAPAILGGGPAHMVLDSLKSLQKNQLPVHTASLLEAARVGAITMTDADYTISVAKAILPGVSHDSGLIFGPVSFDENEDSALTTYDIWKLQENVWVSDSTYDASSKQYMDKIPIGILVPLTGHDAKRGIEMMWGAHAAISEQNKILSQDDKSWRLSQVVGDTATSPDATLAAASSLYDSGIRMILGPPNGANFDALSEFGANNGLLSIGCCSDTLNATHKDTISLASTPELQADAIIKSLNNDNVKNLLLVHNVNDTDISILDEILGNFAGSITQHSYGDSDSYGQITGDMAPILQEMVGLHGASSVGVLLVSYDDIAPILEASLYQNTLQNVHWYGVSRDGLLPPIPSIYDASLAATNTRFSVATPAIPNDVGELSSQLQDYIGFAPSSDAYLMYDSAALLSGVIAVLNGNVNVANISEIMPLFSADYTGVTGLLILDENGQRLYMPHDIWRVVGDGWILHGTQR